MKNIQTIVVRKFLFLFLLKNKFERIFKDLILDCLHVKYISMHEELLDIRVQPSIRQSNHHRNLELCTTKK